MTHNLAHAPSATKSATVPSGIPHHTSTGLPHGSAFAATPVPPHELINAPNERGIRFQGWCIKSRRDTILNSGEIDRLSGELGFPLPEMIFGKNSVTLENVHGVRLVFDTKDALRNVDNTRRAGEDIKVAYSKEWSERTLANNSEDFKDVVKPYDWTYSTEYSGTLAESVGGRQFETTVEKINVEKLKKPEAILYYDDNILFEDELGDNGTAILNVKVRVMPSCFFLLQRFFLRVDDVLFRLYETRVYHEFGQEYLLREFSTREEHYDVIRKKLPNTNPLDISPLTDANWVSAHLPPARKTLLEKLIVVPAELKDNTTLTE